MKRKQNWSGVLIALLLCLVCAAWLPGIKADAANRMKTLKIGKTYNYKLDGKKSNQILCTYTSGPSYSKKLNIYIDGNRKITLDDWAYGWDVSLCKISSSRTLIYTRDSSDNDWCSGLRFYEYKNGQLKSLGNLASITRDYKPLSNWSRGKLIRVGKNQLRVKWLETTKSTGGIEVLIDYKVSGQKITKKGSIYQTKPMNRKNIWTAQRNIIAYKKAGGKKKALEIKAGEKVRIIGVTLKSHKQYLKVKNAKGKTGWYQDPSSYSSGGWFKEALFAG